MRWAVGARTARELTRRNSLTSPYLWLLCLIAVVPATLFWRHTLHLFCFVVVFALTYVWLYVSIRPVQVAEMASGAEETA
jgi:hypothetical protein